MSDTNKPTNDDKYPWLDVAEKRWPMTHEEIIECKFDLKESRLIQEEKVKPWYFLFMW